jgi:hypothetical protein
VPTTVSVGINHANGERTFLTSQGHLAVTTMKDVVARLPRRAGRGDIALLLAPSSARGCWNPMRR